MALEYDSSAFSYFIFTCLVIYFIPATLFVIWRCYKAVRRNTVVKNARTEAERQKLQKILEKKTFTNTICTKCFSIHFVIYIAIFAILVNTVSNLQTQNELKGFDPYEILGVEQGATDREIKKAYRKLSLLYIHNII